MRDTNKQRIEAISEEVRDISWDAYIAGYVAGAREGDADIEDITKLHEKWLKQGIQP